MRVNAGTAAREDIMGLRDRIDNPERREPSTVIAPIVERRGGTERRVPTWVQRRDAGLLKGKSLDERAA